MSLECVDTVDSRICRYRKSLKCEYTVVARMHRYYSNYIAYMQMSLECVDTVVIGCQTDGCMYYISNNYGLDALLNNYIYI